MLNKKNNICKTTELLSFVMVLLLFTAACDQVNDEKVGDATIGVDNTEQSIDNSEAASSQIVQDQVGNLVSDQNAPNSGLVDTNVTGEDADSDSGIMTEQLILGGGSSTENTTGIIDSTLEFTGSNSNNTNQESSEPIVTEDVSVSINIKGEITPENLLYAQVVVNSSVKIEGGGINLHFDQNTLEIQEVLVDTSVWSFASKNGTIDNSKGSVSNILFTNYGGVSGEQVVATIKMKLLSTDSPEITVTESTVNPFASSGNKVTVRFNALAL